MIRPFTRIDAGSRVTGWLRPRAIMKARYARVARHWTAEGVDVMLHTVRRVSLVAALVAAVSIAARLMGAETTGEWRAYAADKASSRYSPLDQINRDTVKNLRP